MPKELFTAALAALGAQPLAQHSIVKPAAKNSYFSSLFLYRRPLLSSDVYKQILKLRSDKELLEFLLQKFSEPKVRMALYFANQRFYELLESTDWADSALKKHKTTLIKYLIRMSFRATPASANAGVGLCHIYPGENTHTKQRKQHNTVRLGFDAMVQSQLRKQRALQNISKSLFLLNPTFNKIKTKYQYLDWDPDAYTPRDFVYSELELNKNLEDLIKNFKNPQSIDGLIENKIYPKTLKDTLVVTVKELYQKNILIAQSEINTLNKYNPIFKDIDHDTVTLKTLKKLMSNISKYKSLRLNHKKSPIKAQLFLKSKELGIGIEHLKKVKSAYYALDSLFTKYYIETNTVLAYERFKQDFLKTYGENDIPILKVFDPQHGLKFESFENTGEETEVKKSLIQFLIKKYSSEAEEIEVSDSDIVEYKKSISKSSRPHEGHHGSNVLFQLGKNKKSEVTPIIVATGGSYPHNLLAPYLHEFSELKTETQKNLKQSLLKGPVIYAEIDFVPDFYTANIIERPLLFNHTLPINNFSQKNDLIGLNDVYVRVHNWSIYLVHKPSGKLILPVFSNPYNYADCKVNMLRFLIGLYKQRAPVGLAWNWLLQKEYYPRVVYKGAVLAPRSWVFDFKELKNNYKSSAWRKKKNLTEPHVILSLGDRRFPLDLDNYFLTDLIFKSWPEKDFVILNENLAHIYKTDEVFKGTDYFLEFSTALYPKEVHKLLPPKPVQENIKNSLFENPVQINLKFHYLELSHLQAQIKKVLSNSKQISQFYFALFTVENENEMRLRLWLKSKRQAPRIIEQLEKLKSVQSCSLTPFEKELYNYRTQHGQTLYEKLSASDSQTWLNISKKLDQECYGFSSSEHWGNDLSMALILLSYFYYLDLEFRTTQEKLLYLKSLASKLSQLSAEERSEIKRFELLYRDQVVLSLTQQKGLFKDYHTWFYKRNFDDQTLWKKAHQSKLFIKSDLDPKHLVYRLIHMTMFRDKNFIYPKTEKMGIYLLIKILEKIKYLEKVS